MMLLAAFAAWRNKFLLNKKPLAEPLPYDEQLY